MFIALVLISCYAFSVFGLLSIMKGLSFPIFNTKSPAGAPRFSLEDPIEKQKYFSYKAGPEIEKLKEFLHNNTFVAILLGPKNSGKGTYTKLFMEAVGSEHVAHISVGDIVRGLNKEISAEDSKKSLVDFLKTRYRGFVSIDKALDVVAGRDTTTLMPTELILASLEREIDRIGRKAIFIDGFPRTLDQISYSLFLRALIGYRNDPDLFVFIDVPEAVVDERIKNRVVFPICQTPRSLRLLRTKEIGYDEAIKEFYLICDTPACNGARMVAKEGDAVGIGPLRERIDKDVEIMKRLLDLRGVPQIFLRNSISVSAARDNVDEYEITPSYRYEWDETSKKVHVTEEPWTITDDEGNEAYSLLPAPIGVSLIKQTASALGL